MTKKTKETGSLPYKIVRTRDAGVFACEVERYDRATARPTWSGRAGCGTGLERPR